jgi:protein-S-isoprenylcysteine O-methyltransferase Ste14
MSRHVRSHVATALLVTLFAGFAYSNFLRWIETGRPVGLGAVFLEAMTALLFLVRRPAEQTSGRTIAWLSAFVGAFAMLLGRPIAHPDAGPFALFTILQLAGFGVALVGLGFLGRSFGVVAACRGVKTCGLYALVRHPVYAAYFVAYTGYVLENASPRNLALFALGTGAQLIRIGEEERTLATDPAYRRYRAEVRYRLIPFVY